MLRVSVRETIFLIFIIIMVIIAIILVTRIDLYYVLVGDRTGSERQADSWSY